MLKLVLLSLLGVALLAAAALLWQYWSFGRQMDGLIAQLKDEARPSPGLVITEAMIATLPEPARRYLLHAGVVGQTIPTVVKLTQTGRIRSSQEAGWMAFTAEEYYSTNPPGFVWRASLPSQALPVAIGRDTYLNGGGSILIKMLATVPVADEHGAEMGEAGLMRYLNEMAWFPAAFLGDNVRIEPVDANAFRVTISDWDHTATAMIFVDSDGRMTNFRAERFNTGTRTVETWETPITAYARWEGLDLPQTGSAVWKLPGGDLTYIELDVTSVTYSRPLP